MAKLSDFFSTLLLAGATYLTGGLAAFTAPVLFGLGATAVLGAYSGSRARAASRNSLTENRFTSRSSVEPKVTLYGQDRLKTFLIYECTHGDRKQFVTRLLGLPVNHELDAIVDVLLDDSALGILTAGQPSGGRYVRATERVLIEQWMAGTTGSTRTLALPSDGIPTFSALDSLAATVLMAQEYERGGVTYRQGDSIPLVLDVDYLVSGRVVTLLVADLNSVMQITATYRVTVGKSFVTVKYFTGSTAGRSDAENAALVAASGGQWTLAHKLRGIAHLEITFEFDPTIYPTGLPNVTAICRGKRLFNPATGLTVWSQSPALAWRDYMVNRFRAPAGQLDDATVTAAATACAVTYTTAAGTTQAGYTVDGICSSASTHQENLEMILGSMLGSMPRSGGKFSVMAGDWTAPVLTLTEDDLADELPTIRSRAPVRERCNVVVGKYRDNRATDDSSSGLYTVTTYPEYASSTYIAEDLGIRYEQSLDLPMTLHPERAQRIAKRHMNVKRQALLLEATFGMTAYKPIVGERVRLPWARYGWAGTYDGGTGKVFRILKRRYDPAAQTVRLTMIEDAQALYDWNFSEATQPDPSSNTDRLNPGLVNSPVVMRVESSASSYTTRDGAIYPYVEIEIAPTSVNDVLVDVYWKRTGEFVFRVTRMPVGVTKTWLEPVSGGEVLNIYLLAQNSIGALSQPTFVLPAYTVSPLLPASGVVPALSANLVSNASFERTADRWLASTSSGTATVIKEITYPLLGLPSNGRLQIVGGTTGSGQVAYASSEPVAIDTRQEYVGYVDIIGWGCSGFVSIQWLDANLNAVIANIDGNVIAPVASLGLAGGRGLDTYSRSRARGTPPAGARYARLLVVAGGTWSNQLLPGGGGLTFVTGRCVFFSQPFLGTRPAGATQDPAWDAGTSLVLGTFGLEQNATGQVYGASLTASALLNSASAGSGDAQIAMPRVVLPLNDPTIPEGATVSVRVTALLSATGLASGGGTVTDDTVVLGVTVDQYAGGQFVSGLVYATGYFWDQHFGAARDVAGLTLNGSVSATIVVPYTRAREMHISLVVQNQIGGNSARFNYTILGGTTISAEVLKR